MKHKHADVIHAYADGAEIQYRNLQCSTPNWTDITEPSFCEDVEYRVKPKPDVYKSVSAVIDLRHFDLAMIPLANEYLHTANLGLTFDGETGKLKSAEVIS